MPSSTINRGQQLADAFTEIARTNHYMIGLTETITISELEEAEQLLITRQNNVGSSTTMWLIFDLALDLIERKRKEIGDASCL